MTTYGKNIIGDEREKSHSMPLRADTVFYQIGKVIWFPFCLAGFWFAHWGYRMLEGTSVCVIKRLCGLPCPGCGGTRAFYHLFLGEFGSSLYMHPAVLYGVAAYLHFMAVYFYRKHISKCIGEREIVIAYYMYIAIGIILLQWLVKLFIIFHH